MAAKNYFYFRSTKNLRRSSTTLVLSDSLAVSMQSLYISSFFERAMDCSYLPFFLKRKAEILLNSRRSWLSVALARL